MEIKVRGVNDAFNRIVRGIHDGSIPTVAMPSRYGDVLRISEPLTITYTEPRERVLFNSARDCNPFFHVFETLHMLSGRNDVSPLVYYAPRMAEFSDNGLTLNGAYGYRWRQVPEAWDRSVDQLKVIADCLVKNPNDRRCVLQMWTVHNDLLQPETAKDLCCNLCCVFQVLNGRLDMTVYNRSNDIIWGTLGANVVHFSFLLEYMAARAKLPMGVYHQISCNSHVYTNNWKPEEWLPPRKNMRGYAESQEDKTVNGGVLPCAQPLVSHMQSIEAFDREVALFVDDPFQEWKELFLERVAKPMCEAFKCHKARQYDLALEAMDRCIAEDWQLAGRDWILRRRANWEKKNEQSKSDNPTSV